LKLLYIKDGKIGRSVSENHQSHTSGYQKYLPADHGLESKILQPFSRTSGKSLFRDGRLVRHALLICKHLPFILILLEIVKGNMK